MNLIREYWWLIAIVIALVLAFLLLRPKQRVTLTDSASARINRLKVEDGAVTAAHGAAEASGGRPRPCR